MMRDTADPIKETSATTPWSRKLYNKNDFWKNSEGLGLHYAYLVYGTLRGDHEDFQPDFVFYVGKSPAAYIKKVEHLSDEVRNWQWFLWNQAVVPLLIVQSKTKVYVYTAYTPPRQNGTERLESIFDTVADVLELDQVLTMIEAGTLYEITPEAFQRSQGVDQYLLRNLNAAASQMAKTQDGGEKNQKNLEFVHQFLTRLLFVCYLIERGMIKGEHFEDEALAKLRPKTDPRGGYLLRDLFRDLNSYTKRKDALCKIFACVKDWFNGSLFPENGVAGEKERYTDYFIQVLNRFLQGEDIKDKQLMLPFCAYDFSIIPIETISAIYEGFLGEQGKMKDAQKTTGAYYTPLHLAELTVDIALEKIKERVKKPIHELKILDPACGSGVFLVSLFGRMAEDLRRSEMKYSQRKLAVEMSALLSNLYGIDINSTACHITCFSLYLALLEQLAPIDIEDLREYNKNKKALIPLLFPHSKGYNTIHYGNLFDSCLSLKDRDFDIIIGNPPWVSRNNQKDKVFLEWREQNPDILGPEKQIAHGFMWKALEYGCDLGTACFLLPSAVILNSHTNKFQKEWLSKTTVERVVNFSDLSFFLFENADRPCVAIKFKKGIPELDASILYESPKTDAHSQYTGPIYVREEDTKIVPVQDIFNAAKEDIAPVVWKSHFWGTWRDQRLINRLLGLPKLSELAGKPKQDKRWIKGQGCQPYTETDAEKNRTPYDPWWDKSLKFLSVGEYINLIVTPKDTVSIPSEFCKLRMSPDKRIFLNPKVIVSQGSRDMKVAFCGFPVLFRHSIQAISGPEEDSDLLRFLAAVIKSNIIQYYLFHTSANWGTERDKVLFHELLSLPFFLPEDAPDPKKAQNIIDEATQKIKAFEKKLKEGKWLEGQRENEAIKVRRGLEQSIQNYYDIDEYEAMLIEDTLDILIKSSTPGEMTKDIPTLKKASPEKCEIYKETLCEMLNHFGKESSFKVAGEVIQGEPYSVIQVSLVKKSDVKTQMSNAGDKLNAVFNRMESLLEHKEGRFVFCQNLKVFDGDKLYILKPMQMRFWSRTAALNDADEIAGAILDRRETK